MRSSSNRSLAGSSLILSVCALAASTALAVTAPVLDIYGTSLTSYKATSKTAVQDLRPRFDQRGVDIDGTLKSSALLGWSIAGDPLGGGYAAGRTLGDINLCLGTYSPTDVDLALPTLGLPVVIGRTYNAVQVDSGNTRFDSDGYQGFNWAQGVQPELRLFTGATTDLDVLYLVYGADRYIELQRIGLAATEFKSKNGAAGVVKYTASVSTEPDFYTYYDQRGNQTWFFGSHANAGSAAWQMWKTVDPAGNVAYVGDATTGATAITNGFVSSTGRVSTMYDASGRKYVFTYSTYGGYTRLQRVEAQINSGSWTTIAKVEYDYFTTTDSGKGLAGDLRLVTTTLKGTGSNDLVRSKYYRYYTSSWSNSDGSRGNPHQIKMVVGFEGARRYDVSDSTFDQDYYAETDTNLKPYAESYFEYVSSSDYRLWKATFNGNCGCAGGSSGTYTLTYTQAGGYATAVGNTSYDTGWMQRTVIVQPDGNWVSQYFDETGAVLARVLTNGDPAGSPTKKWITDLERSGSGQVTSIHSPANITAYTHSTGSITRDTGVGLVTVFARHSASDNLDGLRDSVSVKEGTTGSATTTSSVTMSDRQLVVGSTGVSAPTLDSSTDALSNATSYSRTWHSATNTDVLYLAPKSLTTTHPTVTTGNNGPNSATTSVRYLRTDGSVAYTKDASAVLFYSGRDAFGNMTKQIAAADTANTGDFLAGDAPSTWSLSAGGDHIISTMTYDDQGRGLTTTQPSVNGTRTSVRVYETQADGRLATYSFPRKVSTTYYGPVSFNLSNHAGRPERSALISLAGGSSSVPSATPSSSTWSNYVDTFYDTSGMRTDEVWTYTSYSGGTWYKDISYVGYDSMGRRKRSVDATGTISRSVFDERGMPTERWMGTNDNGFTDPAGSSSGSANMVKIEVMEYDNASSSGGGNGLMTKRTQDADGSWGGTSDQRPTTITYDYRGRAVVQINPNAPHSVSKYDNAGRVIATAQYNSSSGLSLSTNPIATTASTRVALSDTSYDARGQVYRVVLYEIIQSGGSAGDIDERRTTSNWYDANGRLIKTHGSQITKTAYDALGRVVNRYLIAYSDDTTYAHTSTVTGDIVLEQTHTALHASTGRALAQWTVQRAHDDSSSGTTGGLDTNADTDELKLTSTDVPANALPQITATWYDDWDRATTSVAYGTYGGSTFDRTGLSVPSSSATALKTVYAFDDWGRVSTVTDPAGMVSMTEYDLAGRRSRTIDNYLNGTPGDTANDDDRVTEYLYASGLLTSVTRKMASPTDDQVTTYTYCTTTVNYQVATGHLLREVIYDEQYSSQPAGDRTVTYVYNALGQVIDTIDPAGNEVSTTYDTSGRITERSILTLAGGFDGGVKKIVTAYNNRGMVLSVLQKDFSNVTLDEVTFDYDGWGNVVTFTQEPDGSGGKAPYSLTWAYAANASTDGWENLYLASWTQPDGSGGGKSYEDGGGTAIDTYIGRLAVVEETSPKTTLSEYDFAGAGTALAVDYPEPDAGTFLYGTGGSSTYSTYMDRYNRPIKATWWHTHGSGQKFVESDLDYDLAGNAVAVADAVLMDAQATPLPTFDRLDTYDSLRRLIAREEGQLNGGHTSITTRSRIEGAARNLAGRITSDQVSLNNDSDYTDGPPNAIAGGEMDDGRTYNKRNELTVRSVNDYDNPSSPRSVGLTYDKNGNLTDDGEKYTYVYNPFGQLVQISNRASPYEVQAEYTYNGLGHRISERLDCNDTIDTGTADGVVDRNDDPQFFIAVDMQGRRVATFRDTDTYPKETFVYHPASVRGPGTSGGVILRDRNASLTNPTQWALQTAGSTRAERTYYCSDHRGNVTALIDDAGFLLEQYRYSPSGVPYGIPLGDIDSEGTVTGGGAGADYGIVNALISSGYEVRADLDLDNDVDSTDLACVVACDGLSTGRGKLSVVATANRVAFAQGEVFGEGLYGLLGRKSVLLSGLAVFLADGEVLPPPHRAPGHPGITCDPSTGTCYPTPQPWDCAGSSADLAQCYRCCNQHPGAWEYLRPCYRYCHRRFPGTGTPDLPNPGVDGPCYRESGGQYGCAEICKQGIDGQRNRWVAPDGTVYQICCICDVTRPEIGKCGDLASCINKRFECFIRGNPRTDESLYCLSITCVGDNLACLRGKLDAAGDDCRQSIQDHIKYWEEMLKWTTTQCNEARRRQE